MKQFLVSAINIHPYFSNISGKRCIQEKQDSEALECIEWRVVENVFLSWCRRTAADFLWNHFQITFSSSSWETLLEHRKLYFLGFTRLNTFRSNLSGLLLSHRWIHHTFCIIRKNLTRISNRKPIYNSHQYWIVAKLPQNPCQNMCKLIEQPWKATHEDFRLFMEQIIRSIRYRDNPSNYSQLIFYTILVQPIPLKDARRWLKMF